MIIADFTDSTPGSGTPSAPVPGLATGVDAASLTPGTLLHSEVISGQVSASFATHLIAHWDVVRPGAVTRNAELTKAFRTLARMMRDPNHDAEAMSALLQRKMQSPMGAPPLENSVYSRLTGASLIARMDIFGPVANWWNATEQTVEDAIAAGTIKVAAPAFPLADLDLSHPLFTGKAAINPLMRPALLLARAAGVSMPSIRSIVRDEASTPGRGVDPWATTSREVPTPILFATEPSEEGPDADIEAMAALDHPKADQVIARLRSAAGHVACHYCIPKPQYADGHATPTEFDLFGGLDFAHHHKLVPVTGPVSAADCPEAHAVTGLYVPVEGTNRRKRTLVAWLHPDYLDVARTIAPTGPWATWETLDLAVVESWRGNSRVTKAPTRL